MNDPPLSLLLLLELTLAILIAALAALARAAVGAHRVLARGVPGSAILQENSVEARAAAAEHQAAALTAEVMWLGLLSPALLLAAHATQGFAAFLGPFTGFALAAAMALLVGSDLPLIAGARKPQRVAVLARPLLRAAAPLRPLAAQRGRRRAIAPPPEPAAHEAKLIERLFDASSDSGAADDPVTILMRQLLSRVVHLRETPVKLLMRPRADIVWITQRAQPAAAAQLMRTTGHSRIPVCGRDLDDVVSIVHRKDVFLALRGAVLAPTVDAIGRQPTFVEAELSLSGLLAGWRHEGGRMSIVRDPDGRVVGLVTLSDVTDWLLEPITPAGVALPASAAEAAR
jgi:CBS domain containing-hemolysin-like protein